MEPVIYNKDLLSNHNITPAEGEKTVRTYCCTTLSSRFLGIQSNGYLGVTNKRVIYQTFSTQGAHKNIMQSEVPIADISGMTSFKGIYFSLLSFLGAITLTLATTALLTTLIPTISFIFGSYTAFQVICWTIIVVGLVGSFLISVKSIGRPIVAGAASAGFFALAGGSLLNLSGSVWQIGLALLVLLYAGLCCFWYARRPTFSLEIHSKGAANAAISIASASGIFNISATKAVNPKPAQDSDRMLKQLGAVIMDIQMLGDYGIEKWKAQ